VSVCVCTCRTAVSHTRTNRFHGKKKEKKGVFGLFFRRLEDSGGGCGLFQVIVKPLCGEQEARERNGGTVCAFTESNPSFLLINASYFVRRRVARSIKGAGKGNLPRQQEQES
jgi:hypothetical protein